MKEVLLRDRRQLVPLYYRFTRWQGLGQ